ncbi:MAG: hypothetical protein IKB25_09865 [Lentisphaeria bacterium]|nr:hypothetical protein [Lentisphaeria bacterium]
MIPSDHFVRFYNEVFKFLDEKDGLQEYYLEISRHQEFHCLKDFREKGLRGVYDYYLKIRKEENCDLDIILNDGELILKMNTCPSLSKAIDNDAGVCPKYCLHCPGWTAPLYQKAGLYQIFDVMGIENPQCIEWIYEAPERAKAKYKELLKSRPAEELRINFEL